MPFLENVVRGRRVPRARLEAVAEHYYRFGGRSPINDQNRALIAAVRTGLRERGIDLPVYWGNRNWHPLLPDAVGDMARDGVGRALAFVTSAFSSYSGCRQYRENIENARASLDGAAPVIDKIRAYFNHPGFIEAMASRVREALSGFADGAVPTTVFTAHSIPMAMADRCEYVAQLREASALVSQRAGAGPWELAFQSRSGPPSQPWLGPDICDRLAELRDEGVTRVCAAPIGFVFRPPRSGVRSRCRSAGGCRGTGHRVPPGGNRRDAPGIRRGGLQPDRGAPARRVGPRQCRSPPPAARPVSGRLLPGRPSPCSATGKGVGRPVSRFLFLSGDRAAAIHLERLLPGASSDLPGAQARRAAASPPIWSCSAWGLPCRPGCPRRGALLPHHFTLTPDTRGRYLFCGTFRRRPLAREPPGR